MKVDPYEKKTNKRKEKEQSVVNFAYLYCLEEFGLRA